MKQSKKASRFELDMRAVAFLAPETGCFEFPQPWKAFRLIWVFRYAKQLKDPSQIHLPLDPSKCNRQPGRASCCRSHWAWMLNTLRFAEVCDLTLRSMPSCDCSSCTMHTLLHFFQSILFKVWICAESEHAWQPWHHLGLFIIQVELRLITPAGPGLPNVAAVEIVYLQALR